MKLILASKLAMDELSCVISSAYNLKINEASQELVCYLSGKAPVSPNNWHIYGVLQLDDAKNRVKFLEKAVSDLRFHRDEILNFISSDFQAPSSETFFYTAIVLDYFLMEGKVPKHLKSSVTDLVNLGYTKMSSKRPLKHKLKQFFNSL